MFRIWVKGAVARRQKALESLLFGVGIFMSLLKQQARETGLPALAKGEAQPPSPPQQAGDSVQRLLRSCWSKGWPCNSSSSDGMRLSCRRRDGRTAQGLESPPSVCTANGLALE